MKTFMQIILYTAANGQGQFKEQEIPLTDGGPEARLSIALSARALKFRESPVGFQSTMHVTQCPQWVFILSGEMEIGLADGTRRRFKAGEHFYSADTLPEGTGFNPEIHGHWSRQVGTQPLTTLFVID
jgi:hypothetical protein